MKKLMNNEAGISHVLLVIVFVIILAGAAGFAYTKVKDNDSNTQASADMSQVEDVAADESVDANEDDNETDAGVENDQEVPETSAE